MKIEIEKYRGWSISFDTEDELFNCYSDQCDTNENKKSFSSAKKWVDEFIKENTTFKPIWIETKPSVYYSDIRVKLIGIRKDGNFVYENEKGEKKMLLHYDEVNYIIYDEKNDKFREEAEIIEVEIKDLRLKIRTIFDKIVGVELTEYKNQILKTI